MEMSQGLQVQARSLSSQASSGCSVLGSTIQVQDEWTVRGGT